MPICITLCTTCFPGGSVGKESACNAGGAGFIPGLRRSPGERNGNPLQYACLENPMDRGAWQATVRGITRVWHDLATKPPPPPCTTWTPDFAWAPSPPNSPHTSLEADLPLKNTIRIVTWGGPDWSEGERSPCQCVVQVESCDLVRVNEIWEEIVVDFQ